jgi:hypothetical protein
MSCHDGTANGPGHFEGLCLEYASRHLTLMVTAFSGQPHASHPAVSGTSRTCPRSPRHRVAAVDQGVGVVSTPDPPRPRCGHRGGFPGTRSRIPGVRAIRAVDLLGGFSRSGPRRAAVHGEPEIDCRSSAAGPQALRQISCRLPQGDHSLERDGFGSAG